MYEQMIHLCTTAIGAMSGAYFAYRLAERRLRRGESDNFLALLLTRTAEKPLALAMGM